MAFPLERIPPHDLAAERAVIGGLLIDYPRAWPLVQAQGLGAADFYSDLHQAVYRRLTLWAWSERQPDFLTVRDSVSAGERFDRDEVGDYLVQLSGEVPTSANCDFYARTVKDHATRRGLIRSASVTIQRAYEGPREESLGQDIQFALDELDQLRRVGVGREDLVAIDGNQLLADPPAPRDLIVGQGILGLGEWILFLGEAKAGKSAIALDLSAELCRDIDAEATWAGFPVYGGRRVLYLVGEGGRRGMFRRWEKRSQGLGKHERARFFSWFPEPYLMDITSPEDYVRLERFVQDNGIEVVIMDPLAHFHCGDENDAGDMTRVAAQFIRLQATTGCGSIVVHHTRKAQVTSRRGSALEGRGSTALFGASDGAIVLDFEGDQDDPERRMTFSLRHAEEYVPPQIVVLNRALLRFDVAVRDPGGRPATSGLTEGDFQDWVAGYGKPVLLKDAAVETGVSLRTLQAWQKSLIDKGELARWRESGRAPFLYGLPGWFEPSGVQGSFLPAPAEESKTNQGGFANLDPEAPK